MARPVQESNDAIGTCGDVNQRRVRHKLQVTRAWRSHASTGLVDASEHLRFARAGLRVITSAVTISDFGVNRGREVAGDAGDHLRKLNRLGDMVDEKDQDTKIDEHQGQSHCDREVRYEVAAATVRHRSEGENGVDERGYERAERDLGASVAN